MAGKVKIALVTGASAGLGVSLVKALHKTRRDITEYWLVARRADRLLQTAEAVKPAASRVFSLDLTDPGSVPTLVSAIRERDVEVAALVNNAGFGLMGAVESLDPKRQRDMVTLNCGALTELTAAVLPFMGKGSFVLNVSSIASFAPTPNMTVYSATKAYVQAFTRSLREELKPRGVNVLAVCPGPMDTEFLSVAGIGDKSKMFNTLPRVNPDKIALAAVRKASRGFGVHTQTPIFKLYRVLCKILPEGLILKFSKI